MDDYWARRKFLVFLSYPLGNFTIHLIRFVIVSAALYRCTELTSHRGADKNLKLWDIAQRTSVWSSTLAAPAWSFDWQPADVQVGGLGQSKQFAVAGDEGVVLVYRAAGSV